MPALTRPAAAFVAAVTALAAWAPAHADQGPVDVHQTSEHSADVLVVDRSTGAPDTRDVASSTAGQGPAGALCVHHGSAVPCSRDGGWWSASRGCYLTEAGRRLPGSVGGTDLHADAGPDATYYWCAPPGGGGRFVAVPNGPDGAPAVAVVDPEVLARSAVERMGLRAPDIGIVPEPDDPASIGLVGLPVWMWVEQPSPTTWGPVTVTASAGATGVTATAEVGRVAWTMGDGAVVTCTTPGTPYAAAHGDAASPDCGHRYTRTSLDQPAQAYPVSAAAEWRVTWTSTTGATGTIPLRLTSTTQVRVGDLQVLVQDHGA